MNGSDNQNKSKEIKKDQRTLAAGSFYSFLYKYGTYFFSIFTSVLMARMVSQTYWSYLILAISYMGIIGQILSFLPPGLDSSLNYYIPSFLALNQLGNLKSFIKNSFYIRLIFLLPFAIAILLIYQIFSGVFSITLNGYVHLLYIFFPIILTSGLNQLLSGINRGFNMFKLIFLLLVLNNSIYLGGLLVFFLLFGTVEIEVVALIFLASNLIPFFVNSIIVIIRILKISPVRNEGDNKRIGANNLFMDFRRILKYGTPVSLTSSVSYLWDQVQIIGIGTFQPTQTVLGFTISKNYTQNAMNTVTAFNEPLVTSVSKLAAQQKEYEINKIYNAVAKYALFLLLLVTGTLFFLTDFFLTFIYLESYLAFAIIVKLMFFTLIFRIFINIFETYMLSTNRVKVLPIYKLVFVAILAPLFFLGLIFFGIIGAIIGLLIGSIVVSFLYAFLAMRYIAINIKGIAFQYVIFFIAFFITLLLENVIYLNVEREILLFFHLELFQRLEFLSIATFFILFIALNILLKVFTSKDIKNIEDFFIKDKVSHKMVRKVLNLAKKVVK
jgi:O-antigen/teichoic acid export membrane protein